MRMILILQTFAVAMCICLGANASAIEAKAQSQGNQSALQNDAPSGLQLDWLLADGLSPLSYVLVVGVGVVTVCAAACVMAVSVAVGAAFALPGFARCCPKLCDV